jgi:hypothetical protein
MKLITLAVLGLMVASTNALAQAPAAYTPTGDPAIDTPLMAAPGGLRGAATVIKWKADFTYDTLKKGTNTTVCYDKSGQPEQPAYMMECTTVGNLPRAAQNMKFEAGGDKAKTQAMLDAAEKDGSRVKPEYGSVWYHLMGADKDHARTHMTIAVPGATTQSTGLPDKNTGSGVWIMNAGTTTAHLMTPGE